MPREEEREKLSTRLRSARGLRRVRQDEARAFYLHDLTSTIEAAFGERPDFPIADMPAEQETAWSRLLGDYWEKRSASGDYSSSMSERYWITVPDSVAGETIAGTIAVDNWIIGLSQVNLSSLYVRPSFRGRGLATRVLD